MKSLPWWPIPVLLSIVFALLSTACGSVQQAAQRQQRANDLMQIGLAYHSYCDANGKGPTKTEDLLPYIENNTVLMQKAKSDYTIVWGVNLDDKKLFEKTGLSATVLGYETSVPASGGAVLMGDTSVKNMTASEFNAAPKAKAGGDKAK